MCLPRFIPHFLSLLLPLLLTTPQASAQLFSEDFGTAFASISTTKWPSACRNGGSSFNTSIGGCAGSGDYEYGLSGFGSYITTQAISIPASGYTLDFEYAFNLAFSFPAIEIRSGASCGTSLLNTTTLSNTSGACTSQTINLDAWAGQTIYIRFRSNTSSATFYFDAIEVDVGGGGSGPTCLIDEDFGTAFTSLDATTWPSSCRSGASGFNTSSGPCSGAGDYSYAMNGFVYLGSMALNIPATGYTLDFNYSFNQAFSFPSIEFRSGGTCGTSLLNTVTLSNTSGACTPQSINLDAYAGQTVYLRFRSNSSGATCYFDDIQVCGTGSATPTIRWADNFNDNDLVLDYPGNTLDETCPSCGPWVLSAGASLNLVPSGGWNGNTNETEAFPANMPNVYYVRLDRNEWVESPVMDLSNIESFKISFYAKSSSPGTGGGDQWSFSDRLRLQIWDGSAWQTVESMRDDLSASWNGPEDFISAALPFNYYCFTAYKSTLSPGNYYYNSSPHVNTNWFHSGFKFRVLFEGGFSGSPFAWVDDFTFRADADGYSTMIPCGLSFWNQPAASSYGQDPGTSGNNNAEKGVELELDNSINIPPQWAIEADDGDQVTQAFGANESERVVFSVISEQEIRFAFPRVHFYSPIMGWQSSVMSIDNSYTGPGWKYYAVEYISCDLAGGTISPPTDQYRYYFSFEYGIEFIPVFYQLNTSGIEYGGGVTSFIETFDAPDVLSTTNCGTLPVEGLTFEGKWEGSDAVLRWTTDRETNNAGFDLYRSEEGSYWGHLGFVEAVEDGAEGAEYSWRDMDIGEKGDHWLYQLIQVDQGGAETKSEVVQLRKHQAALSGNMQVVPNPSAGRATLQVSGMEDNWGWEVRDMQGKVLYKGLEAGSQGRKVIDLPDLPGGTYFVRVQNGMNIKTSIWVNQR